MRPLPAAPRRHRGCRSGTSWYAASIGVLCSCSRLPGSPGSRRRCRIGWPAKAFWRCWPRVSSGVSSAPVTRASAISCVARPPRATSSAGTARQPAAGRGRAPPRRSSPCPRGTRLLTRRPKCPRHSVPLRGRSAPGRQCGDRLRPATGALAVLPAQHCRAQRVDVKLLDLPDAIGFLTEDEALPLHVWAGYAVAAAVLLSIAATVGTGMVTLARARDAGPLAPWCGRNAGATSFTLISLACTSPAWYSPASRTAKTSCGPCSTAKNPRSRARAKTDLIDGRFSL